MAETDGITATAALRRLDPPPQPRRLATLTDSERDVAAAIGSGAANSEVAASLFMSEATVKAHVSRLFATLGVSRCPCPSRRERCQAIS